MRARMILVVVALLAGCAGDEPSSGPDAEPGIDAAEPAELGDPGPGVDSTVGPPCVVDADCAGVFLKLEPCERPLCAAQGVCEIVHRGSDEPCDDGLACTLSSVCDVLGACVPELLVECVGAGPCVVGVCDPQTGACVDEAVQGEPPCDDGIPCTEDDTCLAGQCVGVSPDDVDCSCVVDKDCPEPDDLCAGQMACVDGQCSQLPSGGVYCDPSLAGPCQKHICVNGQCALLSREDGLPCDDGNPCAAESLCEGGKCLAGSNPCQCPDGSCVQFDDGDLCNGVFECEPTAKVCVVAQDSVVLCPDTGNACTVQTCEPATGLCQLSPLEDGSWCDDDNACTLGDACSDGECAPATPAVCGVPQSCGAQACDAACVKVLACDPEQGCVEELPVQPCNDGKACQIGDECAAGVCTPGDAQVVCDDSNPCTLDHCEDQGGCVFDPAAGDCDDSDPCTLDDHCDPETGDCVPDAMADCDDGDDCTTGFCEPISGCKFFVNNAPCEDGDPCTEGDKCTSGTCKPGPKVCPCNEDANCTVVGGGTCAGVWHCIANQCVIETTASTGCAVPESSCQVSSCDVASGTCVVESLADGSPCSSGDACVVGSVCSDGQCVGGDELGCDDGDPCIDSACEPAVGCVHIANEAACEDGDPCTLEDQCEGGECVSGEPGCDCVEDDDCTQPQSPCSGIVRCVSNSCQLDLGTVVVCGAAGVGPCLTTACDPQTGQCVVDVKPEGAGCSDGDECTLAEFCVAGTCVAGGTIQCDDDDPCTSDGCDPLQGCVHVPVAGPCNDGNPCTTDETCVDGACLATIAACAEVCTNGLDDDGDGSTDCEDEACAEQPLCDVCAVAPFVQCGEAGVPGAIGDAAPSQIGSTGCGDGGLADRVYRFTTTSPGLVAVTLLQGAGSFSLRVLTEGEGGGCDTSSCKASGSEATFDAVVGQIYHVVVEKVFLGGAPNFVLSVTCTSQCVPDCAGTCGDDGCGGTCGTCDDGNPCTVDACDDGLCGALPIPGCCISSADCGDGEACTLDVCQGGQCAYEPLPSCCDDAGECDDDIPCTADLCVGGKCLHEPGPGCCTSAAACDDGDPCTVGACVAGECLYLVQPECCTSNGDCQGAGPCAVVTCVGSGPGQGGVCVTSPLPGCCTSAEDCHDGEPCTHDACDVAEKQCVHPGIPGCCEGAQDCPQTSDPCIAAVCVLGACSQKPVQGCCYADEDCPVPAPCTATACVQSVCVSTPEPKCCTSVAECDDADPCTVDGCAGGQCTHQSIQGCCAISDDCDDLDVCTSDVCVAGQCHSEAVAGCCSADSECEDGDPCTVDSCGGSVCSHAEIGGCCQSDGDCAAGECLSASCVGGSCEYAPEPGCCQNDVPDCFTGDPCLQSTCTGGVCIVAALECQCKTDEDCQIEEDPCKKAICGPGGECSVIEVAGCCASDEECGSPSGDCMAVTCLGHLCVEEEVPGCCAKAADCESAGPCASVGCVGGACQVAPIEGCCVADADCPAADEPCQKAICADGSCTTETIGSCCSVDADCPAAPEDSCSPVECVLGQCVVAGKTPGCCESVADCPAAQTQCKQAGCVGHVCVIESIPGCCSKAGDCPAPDELCTAVDCVDGKCALELLSGCCAVDASCPDDGNPCTAVACVEHSCVSQPLDGCCVQDGDCPAPPADCERAVCFQGECIEAPVAGCCSADADCGEDGDPCTETVCAGGECVAVPSAGCCTKDAECPEDADGCSAAQCVDGQCAWQVDPGCCTAPHDCPQPADPCTLAICDAPAGSTGQCGAESLPGCAVGACLFAGFDESLDEWLPSSGPVSWVAVSEGSFAGSGAAYAMFEPGESGFGELVSPPVEAGGGGLRFRYRLDVGSGDCDGGSLEVIFEGDGLGASLWSTCLHASEWREVHLSLEGLGTGSVVFRLNSGVTGGEGAVWLDDVAISGGDCALLCEGACNDGNPCTKDVCESGACVTSPVPGCCVSPAACDDGDPCTQDGCGVGESCASTPIAGCVEGACLSDTIDGALPQGWSLSSTGAALGFSVTGIGSLSPGGHLVAQGGSAASGHAATVHLPRVLPGKSGLSVRFALRQGTGLECELGRLFVVADGVEHPVHCGYHDWEIVEIPLDVPVGEPVPIELRFEAYAAGPKVELDDLRLFGSCHVIACLAAEECDDADECTLDACASDYGCRHIIEPGCCQEDDDCTALTGGACSTGTCADGECAHAPEPGCADDSCWFAGFDQGLAEGWQFSGPPSEIQALWTVDSAAWWGPPTALHGSYQTAEEGGGVATARLPGLLIGSGDAMLTLRYQADLSGSDCASGALELWLNGELAWLVCSSSDGWETAEVLLGPWVGTVVELELRLRSDPAAGASGDVFVDDVAVSGSCTAVACASATGCDDDNDCTDDACLGFSCVHTTNDEPCDDGDACTIGDACGAGECLSAAQVCDDGETCTDDLCDPAVGCLFVANAAPCDDGDPCTAGDSCDAGLCDGTPILCKDFNGCTRDGCTPSVGCEFTAEPFGAPCASGAPGACWNGQCVDWQIGLSDLGPLETDGVRVHAVGSRSAPEPIRVAADRTVEGAVEAVVLQVGQYSLELAPVSSGGASSWLGIHGQLVVGTGGAAGASEPGATAPVVDVGSGLDLYAVGSMGATWFVGGDGSGVGAVTSTLRRCKQIGSSWAACSVMPIVRSPDQCGKQVPFHVRALRATSSQKVLVAGGSVGSDGDQVARVAAWDGNTFSDCESLGVYSGEVYYDDDGNPATLAVNDAGPGVREVFLAIDGSAEDNVWVAGTRGMVFRFDGAVWTETKPGQWAAAADFDSRYTVRGVAAGTQDVHLVGDGAGVGGAGCRRGFYLHGRAEDGVWGFDRLAVFGDALEDCGDAPFPRVSFADVVVDGLTEDLYVVGWSPDEAGLPRGLVMRLEKP